MIFLLAAILYGVVGMAVGAFLGGLAGMPIRAVRPPRTDRSRPAAGCSVIVVCVGLGALIGGGVGVYNSYTLLFNDGPPHGDPQRDDYRAAEMQAHVAQLDPTVAALAKFKADRGVYPTYPHDLVTGGYLPALPPRGSKIDHLSVPVRVEVWVLYKLSPASDNFVLEVRCNFIEDRRGMGCHSEGRVYDSRDPGWRSDSERQPDSYAWPSRDLDPPPAPK